MASSSTNLLAAHPWKYDVFLSFRGDDTRKSFTDHLHAELKRYGIKTFIDDQLRRGKQISPQLHQVIEESRFSIIIFSEHYAASSWCLDELTKIIECHKSGGHAVLPVFHNVDPSHVRKQSGSYAEALAKHEEAYKDNMNKVLQWREALAVASGISGWDSRDRHESKVVEEIAFQIFNELIEKSPSSVKYLVGMDSRIQIILSLLCIELTNVRMVGIWGMGGVGKTTIAEVVYQRICTQFEAYCFVSNIREKSQRNQDIPMEVLSKIFGESNLNMRIFNRGINLIEKTLHSKKVLIVLDDVNNSKQLEMLVGNHNWFGLGSRIIITTRDKRLLVEKEVDEIFEFKELDKDEAFWLFCQNAFKHEPPPKDFVGLCYNVVDYTKGLPLALKVLGCFLYKRSKNEWRSELEKLKRIPQVDVQNVLRISYDGLDDNQKDVFLDIACFFNGEEKDNVVEILGGCDFFPEIEINILVEKSLMTISNNKLHMHDLIQEMGWAIVREESNNPGKRSRLWNREDIKQVLTTNTGTDSIEGIVLHLPDSELLHFSADVFTKMNKLRVLRFYVAPNKSKLHLTGDLKSLPNSLRSLCWNGYPLKCLPSSFNPQVVVELNMSCTQIKTLWEGNKPLPKLKFINLSHSRHLITTPDFSGAPELTRIILEGCTNLAKVHPSIGTLKKLRLLNLEGCSKLKKLPEMLENMESVKEMFLSWTGLREVPSSIEHLNGLMWLKLENCKKLKKLPGSIGKLTSLLVLNISGCSELKKLPDEMGCLQGLMRLEANGSGIQELPASFTLLKKLQFISLEGCKGRESKSRMMDLCVGSSPSQGSRRLHSLSGLCSLTWLNLSDCSLSEGALPSDLSSLSSLRRLYLSKNSLIVTLPAGLSQLTRLHRLYLEGCKSLRSLPELPSSIQQLYANNCTSLETFSYPLFTNTYGVWGSLAINFQFCNCWRLMENDRSDILEHILFSIRIAPLIRHNGFFMRYGAVLPGNSIPEWFIHQSVGNSLVLKLPPDGDNNTQRMMGLAFCAVFDGIVASDHIWLGYQSLRHHPNRIINYLHFSVDELHKQNAQVVKKCGVRLVYEPDGRSYLEQRELTIQKLETIQYDTVPSISCLPSMESPTTEVHSSKVEVAANCIMRFPFQARAKLIECVPS